MVIQILIIRIPEEIAFQVFAAVTAQKLPFIFVDYVVNKEK